MKEGHRLVNFGWDKAAVGDLVIYGESAIYFRNIEGGYADLRLVAVRYEPVYTQKLSMRIPVADAQKMFGTLRDGTVFHGVPYEDVLRGLEPYVVAARVEG